MVKLIIFKFSKLLNFENSLICQIEEFRIFFQVFKLVNYSNSGK